MIINKTLSIFNDVKGLAASLSPTLVAFIPTDEQMMFLKTIAVIASLVCSALGIAWYIYKFINRKN